MYVTQCNIFTFKLQPSYTEKCKQQCAFFRDSGAVALDTLQIFPVELVYTENNM